MGAGKIRGACPLMPVPLLPVPRRRVPGRTRTETVSDAMQGKRPDISGYLTT